MPDFTQFLSVRAVERSVRSGGSVCTLMQTPTITSLLLGSRDPDRLRSWYRDALGAEPDADGFLHFGTVGVLVDARDDVGAATAEPGRVILNHEVTDIAAAAKRVEATGAPCIAAIEYREDGGLSFATYQDPDGNYVQLIELGPEYWAKKWARETGSAQARGPLADARTAVRLPAQDLERARRFYADKLGLEPAEERPGGLSYECGGTAFVVYQSSGRSPGEFTQMGFYVADIEATVAELRAGRRAHGRRSPRDEDRRRHRRHRGPLPLDRRGRRAGRVVPRQRGEPPRCRPARHGRLTDPVHNGPFGPTRVTADGPGLW